MWFHLKELWSSSRTLQVVVIVGVLGVIVAVASQHDLPRVPGTDPQSLLETSADVVGQRVKQATGLPVVPSVPGQVARTANKAAGVVDGAVDVADKAVGVANTAVDVGKDVVDTGAALMNRLLPTGTSPPDPSLVTPSSPSTQPPPTQSNN